MAWTHTTVHKIIDSTVSLELLRPDAEKYSDGTVSLCGQLDAYKRFHFC